MQKPEMPETVCQSLHDYLFEIQQKIEAYYQQI